MNSVDSSIFRNQLLSSSRDFYSLLFGHWVMQQRLVELVASSPLPHFEKLRRRFHMTIRNNRVSRPHRLAHHILVAERSNAVSEAHFRPSISEHVQRIVEHEQSRTRECPAAPRVRRPKPYFSRQFPPSIAFILNGPVNISASSSQNVRYSWNDLRKV